MYWIIADALLVKVVEQSSLSVGISPFVVMRVIVRAIFDAMFVREGAGRGFKTF